MTRQPSLMQILNLSFPLGRLFGFPLRIHWIFPVFILMEIARFEDRALGAAVMGFLFLSVLIHELGHAFMGRKVGSTVREILLWPLGGLAYISPCRTASDDLKVTLAGPLTHLPQAAVYAALLFALGLQPKPALLNPFTFAPESGGFWLLALQYALHLQAILFCLNLFVPAYPMDGGRVLVALLITRWPPRRVAITVATLSFLAGAVLMASGVWFGLFPMFEAVQIYVLMSQGMLEHHPMFHLAPRVRSAPAQRPTPVAMPLVGRKCPHCQRPVNPGAQMCGFCERTI
ncbi:MAG: hypothetical protein AMXMBFR33_51560 [Candidatus Xenobia bacterium]